MDSQLPPVPTAHNLSLIFEWLATYGYHRTFAALASEANDLDEEFFEEVQKLKAYQLFSSYNTLLATVLKKEALYFYDVECLVTIVPARLKKDPKFSQILEEALWQAFLHETKKSTGGSADEILRVLNDESSTLTQHLRGSKRLDKFIESFTKLLQKPRSKMLREVHVLHPTHVIFDALESLLKDVQQYFSMPLVEINQTERPSSKMTTLSWEGVGALANITEMPGMTRQQVDDLWRGNEDAADGANPPSPAQAQSPKKSNATTAVSPKKASAPPKPDVPRTQAPPQSKKRKSPTPSDDEIEDDSVGAGGEVESAIEQMGNKIRSFKKPKPVESALEEDSFIDGISLAGSKTPKGVRRPRKVWSDEESELLLEAYNHFGFGQWKTIRDFCAERDRRFNNRTTTDCRDRYRVMSKQAQKALDRDN